MFENANILIVLYDSIKPINIFKENNSIYFRVNKYKKYAIAVKK